jgi:acrylyl-CoA reductase (NADPH)
MHTDTYKALLVSETEGGAFKREVTQRPWSDLPAGDVLVRVAYSSLNYKDGLSAIGNKGVTKTYPHVPGVDAAGVVEQSSVAEYQPGEEVIVTGYELGANHDGGFAEYIRVPGSWVVKMPADLTLRESMILGTAGVTAGLSLRGLLHHGVSPDDGPVLVTGATGGVGCMSVALLARAGFHVVAVTGKMTERDFLMELGAKEVVSRDDVLDTTGKPLLSGRWAGAVDTVGGPLLDSAIRCTKPFGAVAACGNVVSGELHTSVYPFILRGIALLGINSAITPMPLRLEVWRRLAGEWRLANLERIVTEVSLEDIGGYIDLILKGGIRGRVLVKVADPPAR